MSIPIQPLTSYKSVRRCVRPHERGSLRFSVVLGLLALLNSVAVALDLTLTSKPWVAERCGNDKIAYTLAIVPRPRPLTYTGRLSCVHFLSLFLTVTPSFLPSPTRKSGLVSPRPYELSVVDLEQFHFPQADCSECQLSCNSPAHRCRDGIARFYCTRSQRHPQEQWRQRGQRDQWNQRHQRIKWILPCRLQYHNFDVELKDSPEGNLYSWVFWVLWSTGAVGNSTAPSAAQGRSCRNRISINTVRPANTCAAETTANTEWRYDGQRQEDTDGTEDGSEIYRMEG